jgi:predicted transcriptional regulator
MQILEKLFGSMARVKIMKLFLFNPDEDLDIPEIVKKTKLTKQQTKKELNNLDNTGLIRKRSFFKEIKLKTTTKKKRVTGYVLNKNFVYLNHLKSLLINT